MADSSHTKSTQPVRASPTLEVAGLWRDADDPANGTKIDQGGNRLQFTRAVSPGATQITLNCADSLHGTFVTVANRA